MRVVMVTRLIDRQGVAWGFTHDWVKRLAEHVPHLDVVAHETGEHDLPANVTLISLGREHGASKIDVLRNLWHALDQTLPQADVLFVHGLPQYAIVSAHLLLKHRKPFVMWYTFGLLDWELRVSHAMATRIVTATRDSFPMKRSRKVTVVGHGVDFNDFTPPDSRPAERTVISVGRVDPSKGVLELIEIASRICAMPGNEDITFRWIGDIPMQAPGGFGDQVTSLIREKGLEDRFIMVGGVPFADVHRAYEQSHVMISLSRTGSLDKVVLEAAGCGLPVLATGSVYRDVIGEDAPRLMAEEGNIDEITAKLAAVLAMPQDDRDALGLRLRERAEAQHSLENLVRNLASVFRELPGEV